MTVHAEVYKCLLTLCLPYIRATIWKSFILSNDMYRAHCLQAYRASQSPVPRPSISCAGMFMFDRSRQLSELGELVPVADPIALVFGGIKNVLVGLLATETCTSSDVSGYRWAACTPPSRSRSKACTVSSAESSWPTPKLPSLPPTYHFCPHIVPLAPPEHTCAAASAERVSRTLTEPAMYGATIDAFAIHRDVYALKDSWSTSQVPVGSQAGSYMMLVALENGEKKVLAHDSSKPVVLFSQICEPFVKL